MTTAEKIAAYEAFYIERFKTRVAVAESELAVAKRPPSSGPGAAGSRRGYHWQETTVTKYIMPLIMGAMSLGSAAVYAVDGDWRRAGYWLSAAAITFFVTA